MKIAYFVKKRLSVDPRVTELITALTVQGASVYSANAGIKPGTDALICFGGDGTFLSASSLAIVADVPLLGVNLGRLGFLSENSVQDVAENLVSGNYSIDERTMLKASLVGQEVPQLDPYALNEVSVSRMNAGTVGIDVAIDGDELPTYWADGLLVATSSGSTAYNLSVGGPVCLPGADVLLVSPIAPHNLGVRPLVVPSSTKVTLGVKARSGSALLTMDNRSLIIGNGTKVELQAADRKLKRIAFGKTNFIDALKTRFFWGQDVRNPI